MCCKAAKTLKYQKALIHLNHPRVLESPKLPRGEGEGKGKKGPTTLANKGVAGSGRGWDDISVANLSEASELGPNHNSYDNLPDSGWNLPNLLHSTVLYCTVLYCTELHCTELHCIALYCMIMQ